MSQRSLTQSKQLFARAEKTHAAGVSSSTRGRNAGWYPEPPVIQRAKGAYLFDVDGNRYTDYLGAHGPLILGHTPENVIAAVTAALRERGILFALPYDLEYQVAEKLVEHVTSLRKVKFSNSGSEACHYAIRLARAVTGKNKILKFEGHYHGWTDVAHFSYHPALSDAGATRAPRTVAESAGTPESFANAVISAPWNEPEILAEIVRHNKDELAAIITEPVMGNAGVILPRPGFLQFLRDITHKNNILLIYDEIITGFRGGLGGAQGALGVAPDITILAKSLGAGFVVSAYGGTDDVMQGLVEERVMHGGTYNANIVAMAAAKATIEALEEPGVYQKLDRLTKRLAEGTQRIFHDAGVPIAVHRFGSLFTPFFSSRDLTNYRDVVQYASEPAYKALHRGLIERGVIIYPYYMGRWYVSLAHSEEDIDNTLTAIEETVPEVKAAL